MDKAIGSRLRGGTKPAETKPAETPAAKPETPPAAAKPGETKPGETTPPAPPAAPAKRVIKRAAGYEDTKVTDTVTKLADVATKLGETVEKLSTAPAAPQPPQPKLDLTEEEQDQIKVLEAMGEMDKARYGHLADSARKFITELPAAQEKWETKFKADWEKKNPTDKFDSEQEREEAFTDAREGAYDKFVEAERKKHKLEYSEREFDRGVLYLEKKPLQEQLAAQQKEIERLTRSTRQQEALPVAKQTASAAVLDLSSQFGKTEEFTGLIGEDGAINEEALGKLEHSKVVRPIVETMVIKSRNFAEAATVMAHGGTVNKEMADVVLALLDDFEASMVKRPAEEQLDEHGRQFVTRAQFDKLSASKRKEVWQTDPESLIAFVNDELMKNASAAIVGARKKADEDLTEVAAAMGMTLEEMKAKMKAKGNGTPAPPAPKPGETTPATAPKPAETREAKPTMATSTTGTPATAPAPGNGKSFLQSRFGAATVGGGVVQQQ